MTLIPHESTKLIKGKHYTLYEIFNTKPEADKKAENLSGRLHIFTGKITEATVTKLPKTKTTPVEYAVWTRKRE